MTLQHYDDLTAIVCPWSMLNEDTQRRLRDCGGPWEAWHAAEACWKRVYDTPGWGRMGCYRQAPRPLRQPSVQWDMMEDWVKAVAMDEDGKVHLFSSAPTPLDGGWWLGRGPVAGCSALLPTRHGPGCPYDPGEVPWQQSLVVRPKEEFET